MTSATTKPLAGIGLAALLALTACGGDSGAEQNGEDLPDTEGEGHAMPESDGTYDFTPNTAAASGEEIRIEVPQELIAVTETYSEDRVLDAVTVRASDNADAQCALEAEYEYRDQDELENHSWEEEREDDTDRTTVSVDERSQESRYAEALHVIVDDGGIGSGLPEAAEVSDDYSTIIFEHGCAASPSDDSEAQQISFREIDFTDDSEIPEGTEVTEENVRNLTADPGSNYDYPDFGYEIGDTVPNCEIGLPTSFCTVQEAEVSTLATADVAVMASGEVHVVNSSVEGYDHEPEHGWIGEDQQVDSDGNVIDG